MNNTIIGSVNQAYRKIDSKVINLITKDNEQVNLDAHLKDSSSNYYSAGNQHAFIKKGITELPDSLKREVEDLDFTYKMGFLQQINHIWISTGNSLFLWNFEDKTDIFRYDCSENVENVETIKVKDQTLLLVSTKAYLYIHGVTCIQQELMKINSSVTVKSDGTIYSNFTVSKNSRPFMQGDDGHLYELNIAKVDRQNQPTYCYAICHTASPILKFLPYFFKSVPQVPVISMAMDKDNEFLFILLRDSSIHSINIQGSQYLPVQRTYANNLDSIHYISSQESNIINLMAVSNKGDRLFYSAKGNSIDLIHTRNAPPLPGSLLFNSLTNESSNLSMYNFGIFATILSKSEKKHLVFTSANSIEKSESQHVLMEDVYSELLGQKVWSINDISGKMALDTHYFAETSVSPEVPSRELCTLSASGITHYVKQRPVDYLLQVISKQDPQRMLAFLKRFGATESSAIGFLLACSSKTSTNVVNFIHDLRLKEEGLLLYVSRIVKSIWDVDVLQENIVKDKFESVKLKVLTLHKLIIVEKLEIDKTHAEFISRIINGIEFVCFMHYEMEWSKIRESLSSTSNGCKFSDLITTEEGALLARDITISAMKHSNVSTKANNYTYISDFLHQHCDEFLGIDNITYYKGIECLQAVLNEHKKEEPLQLSLGYFSDIISLIELETLRLLSRQYCSLHYHIGGIRLAFLKYQTLQVPESAIYSIIFACINDSLNTEQGLDYAKSTVEGALNLTNEEKFHFKIYQWLTDNDQKTLLVTIESTSLEKYIKTQLPLAESLACLRQYHEHRKEYYLALRDLVQLATEVDDIGLEIRVGCLKKAISFIPQSRDDISAAEETSLILSYKEAEIQYSIYKALLENKNSDSKQAASELGLSLKPAEVLYHEYAYTHSLYEDALCLMDLMDLCDWKYAEKAWKNIIKQCKSEKILRAKILDLGERLYPSITSFPVFVVYKLLNEQKSGFSKDFARLTLVEAGVPEEVILDAQHTLCE